LPRATACRWWWISGEIEDVPRVFSGSHLSFLLVLETEGGRIARIRLHPICIEDLGARLPNKQEGPFFARTIQAKCKTFETTTGLDGEVVIVEVK
jgi:hypothetical protein